MEVCTIGFTKKSASNFFNALRTARIGRLIDVRLNNSSQLAGFTKRDDLRFFLREICDADYVHQPLLAPTQEMLDGYKKQRSTWQEYERLFLDLLAERQVEQQLPSDLFDIRSVLLCSEPTPERCHRRLVIEYLQSKWGIITPVHL